MSDFKSIRNRRERGEAEAKQATLCEQRSQKEKERQKQEAIHKSKVEAKQHFKFAQAHRLMVERALTDFANAAYGKNRLFSNSVWKLNSDIYILSDVNGDSCSAHWGISPQQTRCRYISVTLHWAAPLIPYFCISHSIFENIQDNLGGGHQSTQTEYEIYTAPTDQELRVGIQKLYLFLLDHQSSSFPKEYPPKLDKIYFHTDTFHIKETAEGSG